MSPAGLQDNWQSRARVKLTLVVNGDESKSEIAREKWPIVELPCARKRANGLIERSYRPAGKITCKTLTATRGTRKNAARQRFAAEAGQGGELSPVDEHVGVPHEGWASGRFIAVHCTDNSYSFCLPSIDFCDVERWFFELHYWRKCISEDKLDNSGGQSEIIKLRHPASDKPAIFVFSPGNLTVQEVLIFDEKKKSWFIDDNVKSDGKLHLSTPIDPIFLALPYLRKVIVKFNFFPLYIFKIYSLENRYLYCSRNWHNLWNNVSGMKIFRRRLALRNVKTWTCH